MACGFTLKEMMTSAQLGGLLGSEPVSLVISNGKLQWFVHAALKQHTVMDIDVITLLMCRVLQLTCLYICLLTFLIKYVSKASLNF